MTSFVRSKRIGRVLYYKNGRRGKRVDPYAAYERENHMRNGRCAVRIARAFSPPFIIIEYRARNVVKERIAFRGLRGVGFIIHTERNGCTTRA